MRTTALASAVLLGSVLAAACSDNPLGIEESMPSAGSTGALSPESTGPSLAVSQGETFSSIAITDPSATSFSLALGGSKQMSAILNYSAGGTLPAVPYASWRSSDNCVATVTSASPSWGLVKGVKSGTALIIAEAWGKADTVKVTVSGTTYPTQACYDAEWSWNYNDVSFKESPLTATQYSTSGPAAGAVLKKVVLFAWPRPDYTVGVGLSTRIPSEMRYSDGGKVDAKKYVSFSVTDGSVAKLGSYGTVTGLKPGRTKIIARLGEFADTVPLYVK